MKKSDLYGRWRSYYECRGDDRLLIHTLLGSQWTVWDYSNYRGEYWTRWRGWYAHHPMRGQQQFTTVSEAFNFVESEVIKEQENR